MAGSDALAMLDWIAADWGTSALRVWAVGRDGSVIANAASDDGMGKLRPDGFEPALLSLIGDWLPADGRTMSVTVCGMAGARQGWVEAAYRQTPCAPVASGHLTPVQTRDQRIAVNIIPGLSQGDPPDVMRGEETQLAGLVAKLGVAEATVCMPGTHSKWVRVERGQVADFTTFMTGEAFSLFASQSVLRHSVDAEGEDRKAFLTGVADMLQQPERLTAALFGIRAGGLLRNTGAAVARSRLSGLLIGIELAAARSRWEGQVVHVVGAHALSQAYAAALEHAGARPVIEDAEALTLAGLAAGAGGAS
ncbi:MAG: 2-dehydro-3-deoxygalactonokinase [Rhizobiaceae bacterium]